MSEGEERTDVWISARGPRCDSEPEKEEQRQTAKPFSLLARTVSQSLVNSGIKLIA